MEAHFDDPTVTQLTEASVAEMAGMYGGRHGSGAPPRAAQFESPDGIFLVARLDGLSVGCGGLSRFDASTAEIRRMYVVPEARGRGVARTVLDALLEHARRLGYARVRLETGHEQRPAIRLYEAAGFAPIPCWGPYVADERSVCLELAL